MGRASRKKKEKKVTEQDVLGVFYNSTGNLLYGCIAFFKHKHGSGSVTAYKTSAPFVISETSAYEIVVYGSAISVLLSVRRLVAETKLKAKQLHSMQIRTSHDIGSTGNNIQYARLAFEHRRDIANSLILLSTQARNLFDLFPRIDRKIAISDYQGNKAGEIELSDLFDHFVHNQNLFIDENDVRDLIPAKASAASLK